MFKNKILQFKCEDITESYVQAAASGQDETCETISAFIIIIQANV